MNTEASRLRMELERMREVLTSVMYAQSLERYARLDALKDNHCPCCGSAVNLVENGYTTGMRLEPRWKD